MKPIYDFVIKNKIFFRTIQWYFGEWIYSIEQYFCPQMHGTQKNSSVEGFILNLPFIPQLGTMSPPYSRLQFVVITAFTFTTEWPIRGKVPWYYSIVKFLMTFWRLLYILILLSQFFCHYSSNLFGQFL